MAFRQLIVDRQRRFQTRQQPSEQAVGHRRKVWMLDEDFVDGGAVADQDVADEDRLLVVGVALGIDRDFGLRFRQACLG